MIKRHHILALVLVLLAHVFVASGVFHDHLDERPGDCVSCGVASQTALLPVAAPLALTEATVAHPPAAPPRAPVRPALLRLDARGPPSASVS